MLLRASVSMPRVGGICLKARRQLATVTTVVSSEAPTLKKKDGIFKRTSEWFNGKAETKAEDEEMAMLERFTDLALTLKNIPISSAHPLNQVASRVRMSLESAGQSYTSSRPNSDSNSTSTSTSTSNAATASLPSSSFSEENLTKLLADLDTLLVQCNEPYKDFIPDFANIDILTFWSSSLSSLSISSASMDSTTVTPWKWNAETSLRISLLREYLNNLQKVMKDAPDLNLKDKLHASSLMRLSDTFLLGTASERLEEHMNLLVSPQSDLGEWQLQDCLYHIYEPEVSCITSSFLSIKGLHKTHIKGMQKFSKTYLLDKLELNVKSRCIFSWSDPEFTGFKPLPDNHRIPVINLLRSRRQYFSEGVEVAGKLIKDYTGSRRSYYFEKKENKQTQIKGVYFILGTILLDWIVCVI